MKLHSIPFKIVCLLLVLLSYQTVIASTVTQEPEQDIAFQDGFKNRYSNNKYNYDGKKTVSETPARTEGYGDYTNEKEKLKEQREKNNSNQSISFDLGPFSLLFYIILIGVVVYLAYILLNEGSIGLFSRRQHQKLDQTEDITAENIEKTDIDYLIEKAENEADFRLAIKYYYLSVLKTLSLKNHIKIEDDKTNSEYLNEIFDTPYRDSFKYTSYLYDYIWYGEFPLNAEKYKAAKRHFVALIKQVK